MLQQFTTFQIEIIGMKRRSMWSPLVTSSGHTQLLHGRVKGGDFLTVYNSY